jgi:hypothetical protein
MFKDFNKNEGITNTKLQGIALRHLGGVFVPKEFVLNKVEKEKLNIEVFATLLKKFEGFGYTFDKELAETFNSFNKEKIKQISETVLDTIRNFKSAKDYTIFYRNFPEEVLEIDTMDKYFVQFLHYLIGYLPENAETEINEETIETEPSRFVKLSHLKLITEKELKKLLIDLLSSNITLSAQYLEDALCLLNFCDETEIKELLNLVKMKETLMSIAIDQFNKTGNTLVEFSTATDVLRFIAKLSEKELNSKYIKFNYFNRPKLNILMQKLENVKFLLDDMKRYKKPWHKFFELNAQKINFNKFPKVKEATEMLFGKIKHITARGKFDIEKANISKMNETELENFLSSFSKYSGDYVRNLLSLANKVNINNIPLILKYFEKATKEVNTRLLLQLYDRILNLNNEVPRVVNAKGTWIVLEETIDIPEKMLETIKKKVYNEIYKKLTEKEPLGKVYIDKCYQQIMVTTSEKDSNVSLKPMTRGSIIKFDPNVETLRFYVGWKNFKGNRVDLDLSAVKFDENFNYTGSLAYYNQDANGMAFSGDITDAPKGALEFIDIFDLEIVKKDSRYILMTVRSFNGYTFKEMNTAYAGVLELSKKEAHSKKNLYSSAVKHGFSLTGNVQTTNTILVDLEKSQYYWLDMNLPTETQRTTSNYLTNAEIASLGDLINYFTQKKYITMYQLLELNALARGELVDTPEEADTIFTEINEDNNLPLADILANYL